MPPPPEDQLRGAVPGGPASDVGHREGRLAIGFGIAGLLIGVLAFVALYFAAKGQRLAEEAGAEPPGSVRTGRILAWIGAGLWVAGIVIAIASAVTG